MNFGEWINTYQRRTGKDLSDEIFEHCFRYSNYGVLQPSCLFDDHLTFKFNDDVRVTSCNTCICNNECPDRMRPEDEDANWRVLYSCPQEGCCNFNVFYRDDEMTIVNRRQKKGRYATPKKDVVCPICQGKVKIFEVVHILEDD